MVNTKKITTNTKRSSGNRAWLPLLVGVMLLIALGAWLAWHHHSTATQHKISPTAGSVDLTPATPAEQQDSDQHKDASVQNNKTITPPGGAKTVQPVIVSAAQNGSTIVVRSFVSGVIEDGGTCTATFTNGDQTVSGQSQGVSDATTTLCGKISVDRSAFPVAGSWSVTLNYSSANATGTSAATKLEIQ